MKPAQLIAVYCFVGLSLNIKLTNYENTPTEKVTHLKHELPILGKGLCNSVYGNSY